MKSKIIVSTVSQVVGQMIVAGLSVVTLKIATVSLGLKGYGLYATILVFVSTFSLLTDLGLNAITAREIAKYPGNADEIISHNMGLRLFLCIVMIPIIFGISFIIYPHEVAQLRIGILLFSTYLFFDAVRSVSLSYFTSKVRNDISAAISVFQQVITLALFITAALLHWNLYGFIYAYLIANFLSAIVSFYFARKHVHIWPRFSPTKWKSIIAISFSLGVIQVINMFYLKADSIILSIIKGTTVVGIYNVAYSLILAFLTLPSFIMSALIPSIATSKNIKNTTRIIQKAFDYMAIFACLLASGGLLVRNEIIATVANKNFALAASPFAILALASAFSYLNNVFGFASVSLNKHHKIVYISVITLVLNIVLNIIMVPRYSIVGAAWATAISELIALFWIYHSFYEETTIRISLFSSLIKPVIASGVMIVIVSSLHFLWSSSNALVNLFTLGFLISIVFMSCLYVIGGFPIEAKDYINKKFKRTTFTK